MSVTIAELLSRLPAVLMSCRTASRVAVPSFSISRTTSSSMFASLDTVQFVDPRMRIFESSSSAAKTLGPIANPLACKQPHLFPVVG